MIRNSTFVVLASEFADSPKMRVKEFVCYQ